MRPLLLACVAAVACAAPPSSTPAPLVDPRDQAAADAYKRAQDDCIDAGPTLDASRACRDAVKAKWGRQ